MEGRRRRRGSGRVRDGGAFRSAVYVLVGVVATAYLALFVLVVSRHVEHGAHDRLARDIAEQRVPGSKSLRGVGLGPNGLLGSDALGDRWSSAARIWKSQEGRPSYSRRRLHICTQPRFRDPPGPMAVLASFPGSGNTWIRFLLQQATGYLTGSVYRDYSLKRNGFPGESVANGSVLVVKTHEWGETTRQRYSKAILLVRNPRHALLAEFHRRAAGHVGHAAPHKFLKGDAWSTFVQTHAKLWMESVLDWLQFEGPLLVVRYEAFADRLPAQLHRLLRFLGQEQVPPPRLHCVMRNREGIFRRPRKPAPLTLFDGPLRAMVDAYQAVVDLALRYHELGVRFDVRNSSLLSGHNNSLQLAMASGRDRDPLSYPDATNL